MQPPARPPSDYTNAGTMMLISGIFNVLISAGIIVGLALSLIGLCVAPIWLVTLAGGVYEIVVGIGIMQGNRSRLGLSASVVGLVSAVVCGNVFGMILEILAMVSLGKPTVAAWLDDPGHAPELPGPADFPPTPQRRAGPSVSWTGDLPLEQKTYRH